MLGLLAHFPPVNVHWHLLDAAEYRAWFELVSQEYKYDYTHKNRSTVEPYFFINLKLRMYFHFTALVVVPGKGLCYAHQGDTPDVYRISESWGAAVSHKGVGARARETWKIAEDLIDLLRPNTPVPSQETNITLAKF